MIRLDLSAPVDVGHGVASGDLEFALASLLRVRERWEQGTPALLRLPEETLRDYEERREASPLGRVFAVANGLHDFVDAVLMTGTEGELLPARALIRACCDPHHNELNRATRGSKPRMYFADDRSDTDSIQSLLQCLSDKRREDSDAIGRWVVVAVQPERNDVPSVVADRAAELLWDSLNGSLINPRSRKNPQNHSEKESLNDSPRSCSASEEPISHRDHGGTLRVNESEAADESGVVDGARDAVMSAWMKRLLVPVAQPASNTFPVGRWRAFGDVMRLSEGISSLNGVMSVLGLLPTAFVGLDCIQLLLGAHAMTQHFLTADPGENLPLRYAAARLAMPGAVADKGRDAGCVFTNTPSEKIWTPALAETAQWAESLWNPKTGIVTDHHRGAPGWLHSQWVQQWVLENPRADSLACRASEEGAVSPEPKKKGEPGNIPLTLHRQAELQQSEFDAGLAARGIPTLKLIFPRIDTHVMGQTMQMLMIAAALRNEMVAIS
ncbi:MAG: hypothetical protein AAF989_15035 [Planctomycetota bacterium]